MSNMKHRIKHNCSLDLESENYQLMQPRMSAFCRRIQKTFLISKKHPSTYRHFRSYPMLVAERHRQILEADRFIIHPLSSFSWYWNSFMVLVNIAHMSLTPFRLTFVLHPLGQGPQLHWLDHVLFGLHLVCIADIIVKFHTGFLEGNSYVVLDRLRCAGHYIRRYFLIDLISCLPISYILLVNGSLNPRYILIGHLTAIIRLFSIYRDCKNYIIFIKRFNSSYLVYVIMRNVLLFMLSAHWLSCLTFFYGAIIYYWNGEWPYSFYTFLTTNSTLVPNIPIELRYKKAAFVCFSALFGTSFSMYQIYEPIEIIVNVSTVLYASMFMIYTLVYLIKVYFTKHNSIIRYHELMNQLKEYMRQKQFPAALKNRVYAFYYYRYQGTYFREDTVMSSLSDHLRNEIALHTCHKLVNKVALFDGLPADVVGSILGYLHAEVYLPNDLVVRAGDLGDCMYFIANGTVAVYSLKGVEVCHLEDGAYFGEVALLMKDSKRVATVVAVEITQVYRLDADHFRYFIDNYVVIHERIQALASQRMHETVLLDEAFKRSREREHSGSPQFSQPNLNRNIPDNISAVNFSKSTLRSSPRASENPK